MFNFVIPTLNDLDLMHEAKSMPNGSNAYYILAHFWIQDEKYREFFINVKRNDAWILLDNSAAEKELVTEEILLDIVWELIDAGTPADEVIPLDILGDFGATMSAFYSFAKKMKTRGYLEYTKLFAVPQGKTVEEWTTCYNAMRLHPDVVALGLSKITVPRVFFPESFEPGDYSDDLIKEGRHECTQFLYENDLITKPLHYLGMGCVGEYEWYKDEFKYEWSQGLIRSTDSCYTILAATKEIDFHIQYQDYGEVERVNTTNDFYTHKLTDEERALAIENINFMVDIILADEY